MRIGLFIPCYVNDFYPEAAMATLEVLENLGFDVVYPETQKCCGQPFINNGLVQEAMPLAAHFLDTFGEYDCIVAPSSSCVGTVRERYKDVVQDKVRYENVQKKVYELCEFLHDVVGVESLYFPKSFHGKVGLHNSCHATRELHLAASSELVIPHYSKIKAVLQKVEGIDIVEPKRDECCGFGGTFSLMEPDVSAMMGRERIADHRSGGVTLMAGVDMSCLMHMQGIAERDGIAMRFVHVAQILAGRITP